MQMIDISKYANNKTLFRMFTKAKKRVTSKSAKSLYEKFRRMISGSGVPGIHFAKMQK